MLRSLEEMKGYEVRGKNDEKLGVVKDCYFDDISWIVRYFVIDIASAITASSKETLAAAETVQRVEEGTLDVSMRKEQMNNAPCVDTAKPVSRQHEVAIRTYYGWPQYWNIEGDMGPPPLANMPPNKVKYAEKTKTSDKESHLRSIKELTGYYVNAAGDEETGEMKDVIADTDSWHIRYIAVDVKNAERERTVLVPPSWANYISWDERRIGISEGRLKIMSSPEYHPGKPVNRNYEEVLYDYYGRPYYW